MNPNTPICMTCKQPTKFGLCRVCNAASTEAQTAANNEAVAADLQRLAAVHTAIHRMFQAPNVGNVPIDSLFVCIVEQQEIQEYLVHGMPAVWKQDDVIFVFRKWKIAEIIQQYFRGYIDGKLAFIGGK